MPAEITKILIILKIITLLWGTQLRNSHNCIEQKHFPFPNKPILIRNYQNADMHKLRIRETSLGLGVWTNSKDTPNVNIDISKYTVQKEKKVFMLTFGAWGKVDPSTPPIGPPNLLFRL